MNVQLIKTNELQKHRDGESGEVTEILSKALCGAENVVGKLRWLEEGEKLVLNGEGTSHQLVYLMDGSGSIALDGSEYEVTSGAGVYVGPQDAAEVAHRGSATMKLLHLVVPSSKEGV